MEGIPKKQYGLIIPKKTPSAVVPGLLKKSSVFKDSDSEEETPVDWMQKTLQKETYGGARSKHFKAEIEKNQKEDPTIYQYDEVYDQIDRKRQEALAAKEAERFERKPRYMSTLKATAEKRKKENERRIARQVQKERDAEGEEFADKEVFVTSAYKKKLEEMKAAEEEEKEQERLEAIGDVTKQGDLSGFYRHLYEKVVLDIDDEDADKPPAEKKKVRDSKASRQYRKRKSSESDDELKTSKPEVDSITQLVSDVGSTSKILENPDADSDLSDSESNLKPEDESMSERIKDEVDGTPEREEKNENLNKDNTNKIGESDDNKENEVLSLTEKPKISVWEKRTVGELFDAALQRFYERKASRLADLDC